MTDTYQQISKRIAAELKQQFHDRGAPARVRFAFTTEEKAYAVYTFLKDEFGRAPKGQMINLYMNGLHVITEIVNKPQIHGKIEITFYE